MSILLKVISRCNTIPIKIIMAVFIEIKKKKILIFHFMEPQKTPNSQINLKKKQQSCRDHTSWPQAILQSYSNQKSMALA